MKKQLRSRIKSLAKQILSDSDGSNTGKMKETARKLYELLAVLEYLEIQLLGDAEKIRDKDSLDSKTYRENTWFKDPEPVMEKIKDLVAQMPEESQKVDALLEEVLPKKTLHKNELEQFASDYQEMPVFERKDDLATKVKAETVNRTDSEISENPTNNNVDRPKSLNETLANGLNIGLNDRLAFIKHLFEGKTEDYNRVLSQINTYSTYEEAESFIKGKVKPDYNYWLDKEEYSKRFMKIIEKNFR